MTVKKLIAPGLVVGLVFGGLAYAPSTAQEKKDSKAPPWELIKAKVEAARKTCKAIALEYLDGKATVEQCHQWSQRWMNAQRDLKNTRTNMLEALEEHVTRMQELERAAQERLDKKRGQISDVYAAEYHRIEAELALSKAKSSR